MGSLMPRINAILDAAPEVAQDPEHEPEPEPPTAAHCGWEGDQGYPPGATCLEIWDAQVRMELAAHRRAAGASGLVAGEHLVLEALAVLISTYPENGPWRAAMTLFVGEAG